MATNLRLILDKRRKRKDNSYPIVLRLIHNRNSTTIQTGYNVEEKDWNDEGNCIRYTCKLFPRKMIDSVNRMLTGKLQEANNILTKLDDHKILNNISVSEVKARVQKKSARISFETFTNKLIDEFRQMKRFGSVSVYQQALNFVKKNNHNKDLYFDAINYAFIKKIEVKFISEGNSINGLSFYLRTIRAIYNNAIKENIAHEESNPFKKYQIKKEETKKRAIKKEDIVSIENLKLVEYTPIWHAKNYFLFSFYTRGINFADTAKLKLSNINDDRLVYRRSKTSGLFTFKINDKMHKILSFYINDKSRDDFIFPIIKRSKPEEQVKDYMNERKIFNDKLKEIASMVCIKVNLTSYVARHTWASLAKKMGYSTEIISEGLGHKDIKTTQIYLESFENKVLDDANEKIIG